MAIERIVDKVRMAASRLSPREQALLGAASAALLLLVLTLVVVSIRTALAERESRISIKQEGLATVMQLSSGYRTAQAERRRLESQLRGAKNVSLVSVMEGLARGHIAKMTPRRPVTKNGLTETSVDVTLDPVSVDTLASILNGIARAKGVLRVRKLRLRRKFNDKEKVDASFTVTTYALAEGGK
jgi:type II secretory pathway component PulM